MKKLFAIILCLLFCLSCKEKEMIDGDKFNLYTPAVLYFDSDGGSRIVTASDFIILHRVYLWTVNNEKQEKSADIPTDSQQLYPYKFETEWVTVNRTDAKTLEITVPPSTDRIKVDIFASGIDDDGRYLEPNRIQIYQNYDASNH